MSAFSIGGLSVPAFSGKGTDVNRRMAMCNRNTGPIPAGTYYIFDRQSGGLLGPLKEILNLNGNDKRNWFSLYAIDDNIDDDKVICNEIIRGEFRLHPKGPLGLSEGCITIEHLGDWGRIRSPLKRGEQFSVPGSALKTYGRVTVR
ncbi:DUF2778 domain-containing protein [Collimonas antrihumi]|uniref:DUF2778 domain-containing protein n=1 Tax=Collimonas antrihumi TaxID=1940615 RepID=UPI0031B8164B